MAKLVLREFKQFVDEIIMRGVMEARVETATVHQKTEFLGGEPDGPSATWSTDVVLTALCPSVATKQDGVVVEHSCSICIGPLNPEIYNMPDELRKNIEFVTELLRFYHIKNLPGRWT